MATRIPIFLSAPTALNAKQAQSYNHIVRLLERENLETRALGRSEYPTEYPLKEVYLIARRCAGGVVLGYSQMLAPRLNIKPGVRVKGQKYPNIQKNAKFPTPWNHLEAGILFSLRLPLMVFREEGISGGVFDKGVTDVFINRLPVGKIGRKDEQQLMLSIQIWVARVREHYRKWE
jgi:hypothetical protein